MVRDDGVDRKKEEEKEEEGGAAASRQEPDPHDDDTKERGHSSLFRDINRKTKISLRREEKIVLKYYELF